MDQIKTGQFLKTLRNEKGMTQEMLAKHFNVSSRTVSRWETGSNLPDISLLTEIADFYDVDVREIIDGERKSEMMDKEIREVADKMAAYSNNEKNNLLRFVQIAGIAGIALTIVALVLQTLTYEPDLRRSSAIFATFIVFVVMCVITLYVTGLLQKISRKKKLVKAIKVITIVLLALVTHYVLISFLVIGLFGASISLAPKVLIKDTAQYNKYIHNGLTPASELGMGEDEIFNVMPEKIEGVKTDEFQLFYYNPWDPQYMIYMTLDLGDGYDEEISRLKNIGVEDYKGIYTVTGEPEGYDMVAMNSDPYQGFVYAMIPENAEGNSKITYVAIVFCNYSPDVDVTDYIPEKYVLPGLDVSDDNPYKESMMNGGSKQANDTIIQGK